MVTTNIGEAVGAVRQVVLVGLTLVATHDHMVEHAGIGQSFQRSRVL